MLGALTMVSGARCTRAALLRACKRHRLHAGMTRSAWQPVPESQAAAGRVSIARSLGGSPPQLPSLPRFAPSHFADTVYENRQHSSWRPKDPGSPRAAFQALPRVPQSPSPGALRTKRPPIVE